ncbi:MAG: glycosyltransferase [Prolixibacteraceae bacterium]|nr:glycosyltransferase [Prolixibacteraceae bacterium]
MKILIANKFFYPKGGDCVHTIALKQLLEEKGHEVAVFSMQHPENIVNEYNRFWPSQVGYNKTENSNLKKALLRPVYSPEVKLKWNRLIDEFKPDLVHLQNIHTQLSPVIAEESFKKGIPVFWTLHDFKLICPAYSMLREGKPCEKCLLDKKNVIRHKCIKNSLGGSILGYIEALKWTRKKLEKYTTGFIAPSVFLKNKMTEAGFNPSKFNHIYNFVDDQKFISVPEKENYYVYLGRLSEEKGIKTLLKAASRLPQFNLKIIGDGPLKNTLKNTFSNKNIKFLGFQPWNEIKTILGKAKFMVLPSECYENNPLSIIESFAVGTPVLGAEIGGIPELISPGENGSLFKPGDVHSLQESIIKMMKNENYIYLYISETAKKKFNSERYYNELLNYYSG